VAVIDPAVGDWQAANIRIRFNANELRRYSFRECLIVANDNRATGMERRWIITLMG
jgi:hypothetical protein